MMALSYSIVLAAALSCFFASEISAFSRPLPTVTSRRKQLPSLAREYYVSPLRPVKRNPVLVPDRLAKVGPLQQTSSPFIKLASSPVGALVILAGVVLFHEGGHYLTARALGVHAEEFSIGLGPKILGFQAFGDEFNLRVLPVGGYVKFPADVLSTLAWQPRVLISSAGVIFNMLLAFLIYLGQIILGAGLPQLVLGQGVLVSAVSGPDAAASGILRQGDVIVGVRDEPITMSLSPSAAESQRAITSIIETIQATPDGESLRFSILRPNRPKPVNVSIKPKRTSPSQLGGTTPGPLTIGVFLEPNVVAVELLKTDSVLEAAGIASNYVFVLAKDTATGLVTVVGDFVSGKGGSSEYGVRGPIGVIKTASEVVATQDWNTVLKYAAALSINLGVVNTFPIPPSDGFYIVFALAQALWSQSQS